MKERTARRGTVSTTSTTIKKLSDLLPAFATSLGKEFNFSSKLIIDAWPTVIGEKLAPMTHAISFKAGVLTVNVSNSSLYSLLASSEKMRVLISLQKMFPSVEIKNVTFKMGTSKGKV